MALGARMSNAAARDQVDSDAALSPPVRLKPSRTFRPVRRPDARVLLGAGLALLSLAAVDRDASSAAARLNRGRREGMRKIAQRMQDQGALRDDVTVEEAADFLWLITSFETFGQLYRDRSLTPKQVGERLMAITRRTLYKPND